MPSRDWFAAFVEPSDTAVELRATRATRATSEEKPQKPAPLSGADVVAHQGNARATRATSPISVAQVAHQGNARATSLAVQKSAEGRHFSRPVAPVAPVAHDFDGGAHESGDAVADTTEAANLIELFHERCAIREFDGHWPRDLAERLAFAEVVETWCRQHPLLHDPAVCAGCHKPLSDKALDLPDGAQVHWERGREFSCLIAHGFARKRRAVAALATMGLDPPRGWEP